MKKSLFLFAAAALVFASCSNDVKLDENKALVTSNQQKEIAFAPLSNTPKHAIKRAAVDGTTFLTTDNIEVAAYLVTPAGQAGNYFDPTTFVYNSTSTLWEGNTKRYWPLSACYINFLGYANFNGSSATWGTTHKASGVTLVMTDNSSAQKDLMYAIGNGEVTQTGNTLTFPTKVDMAFKHAQAWIKFEVTAANAASEAITVNSITLNGAKYAGTYVITHTNYNATSGQSVAGAWTPSGDAANVAVPGWSATALNAAAWTPVGNGLMIVPDDAATADFTNFTINYSYDGKTYDYTYTPASVTVDQAHSYTYKITFTLHEIKIAASVENWDNTDIPVNIP